MTRSKIEAIDDMEVTIRSAKKSEAGILANLLPLYMHDFSEFDDVAIAETGKFEYPYLDHYWQDPDRYPFLIYADNNLAGFILIRFEADPLDGAGQMDVAEFFVLRGYRRHKVGSAAAILIWDLFPGRWQVRVLESNKGALPFWEQLIASYSVNHYNRQVSSGGMNLRAEIAFTFNSRTEDDIPPDVDMENVDY